MARTAEKWRRPLRCKVYEKGSEQVLAIQFKQALKSPVLVAFAGPENKFPYGEDAVGFRVINILASTPKPKRKAEQIATNQHWTLLTVGIAPGQFFTLAHNLTAVARLVLGGGTVEASSLKTSTTVAQVIRLTREANQ